MQYFKGKNVLVYGMGKSGQSACKILHKLDACVSIFDDSDEYKNMFCFDENPYEKEYDLVVVSPGIKVIDNPLISHFLKKKTSVISELDLGSSFTKGKVIAITGTNGKTTVTSLVGEILKLAGKEVFVCGNIGLPLCEVALKTSKKSFIVCEVSNFQLELSSFFNPDIACILNLQEDHLDRHKNFAEYVRVKNKITQNFTNKNLLVYNQDDSNSKLITMKKHNSPCSKFVQKNGCYVKNGEIFFNKTSVMKASEIPLPGDKNLENVLCTVNICMHLKVPTRIIREGVMQFVGITHRLEFVGEFDGVQYINDSKSTNVACVLMAVESLKNESLILLIGGKNKALSFSDFFGKGFRIKKVVCFGDAGQELSIIAKKHGCDVSCFKRMKEAVLFAKGYAKPGDTVLLSPGCASFDEFSSYAERGDVFKELVSEKN